ncbi:Alginate O-acetyltransferase AlgF, periplasmic [Pseudomonas chlororaphis subsp. aurantiaca]|jgi:alginate O-acetyltransferase complex protein AlgF|uniref:Alginate biosynthesis protein AlgF n=1 Tax=Pseudomonas chlororaphis subsp. aurantiaca TaxID=86192 RepID=A0AAJ1E4L8_9PSED|nr:alginate O-acetyltransferase AlgF [Pseudomonas chlororaphis]AIS14841.1 alginate O-acetyltransferase [Pseudomonas chlororaphis subsp. aurantiaca]AZD20348.1 Alginate O-acetyltransferase AlgF, periplasmic [Pseudomonas chlororaphis subsp. aurantiaca]AZD33808.1 Alginate O-acetyltransferase AlgF, periplasmic [Pseudomonas chlororaphis subsp. aurantiaca]AZD40141.1 Alginate O-acetyltransferase AlgF, periplasmic [Pseudomonas chlororaphis subsp. aurantiaca]AZD46466.1 Alginate O-acetyltransferase AlgF,
MTFTTTNQSLAKAFALVAGVSLLSMQAFAGGDAALYGPTAPKGSSFVRIYNASNQEVSATVGTTNLSDVAPLASSDFSFMPGGDYTAKVGSQSVPVKLAADHYYTLVNNASGQPQLIEEPPFKNKQKSLVRVQNLSDKALTLKTADGKTDVVQSVAAKGRGEREINPVKVSFALYEGEKKVSDLKPVALERGEAAVLYVTGNGSSLSPVWVKRPVSTR